MNGIIDSISNLLMPLCSVWIVNKFVNNSFEKKESKKIFTRIIWGLFILIQIVMETESKRQILRLPLNLTPLL